MNKKGFTLVEILVTIGLLALLGVGIGVSLNKVLKNQEENSYESFIEKIKSSTLLYSSNSAQILNELEYDYGYKLISMKELIDDGYIKGNLKNPNTNEAIKDFSRVDVAGKEDYSRAKVYYTMDKEMVIEYPFIKPSEEIYLNVINYTTTYKSGESNLCYKGLNTSSLGLTLVESGGLLNKELNAGISIIAYMEDGSKCTDANLNTSKVGTYKIRYVYTINGTNAENNPNAKSVTRNIIVKPTKPVINKFEVARTVNENDVYKATMKLKASDVQGVNIRYCLVATKKDQSSNISMCSGTSNSFSPNKWISISNGSEISKNFDIRELFPEYASSEAEIRFFVFVRNDFEEYVNKEKQNTNEIGTKTYLLTSTVIFNLESGSSKVYLEDMKTEITNPIKITGISNVPRTKFNQVKEGSDIAINKYNRIVRNGYYFDGWYTEKNGGGTKYTKDTTTEVLGLLNLYASWKADSEKPTCTISASSSGLSVDKYDNFGYPVNGSFDNSTLSNGSHTYTFIDWASNKGSCSTTISDQSSYEDTYTYWESEPYDSPYSCEQTREVEKCTGGGYTNRKVCSEPRSTNECKMACCTDCWYSATGYAGPGCYISESNGSQTCEWVTETYWGTCYETKYRDVEKTGTYTVFYCESGTEISGTYKCIS